MGGKEMKVIIELEQFDNGITIKWKDAYECCDDKCIVVLDTEKETVIGQIIWDDVKSAMDLLGTNKIKMKVTYSICKGKEMTSLETPNKELMAIYREDDKETKETNNKATKSLKHTES